MVSRRRRPCRGTGCRRLLSRLRRRRSRPHRVDREPGDRLVERGLHGLELPPELGHVVLAVPRRLGQPLLEHEAQVLGHAAGPKVGRCLGGDPAHERDQALVGCAGEGGPSRDKAVQRGREGVHVGRDGGRLAGQDLGGSVHDRPGQAGRGAGIGPGELGHPEVGDFGLPQAGEQDVLGLEVTVEDVRPVSGLDGPGDPAAVVEDVGDLERPLSSQLVGEGAAVEELHDDEEAPVAGRARLVHGDDVGVAGQGSYGGTLTPEPVGGGIVGLPRQHLDGHFALERGLPRPVDGGETAAAELRDVGVTRDAEVDRRHVTEDAATSAPRTAHRAGSGTRGRVRQARTAIHHCRSRPGWRSSAVPRLPGCGEG